MSCTFTGLGRDIITMFACILDFTTNEYVDEITFPYMSIFTPGKPPATKFDYATFIADKMHEKFMRLENERVFKYSSVLYHLFLYYQTDKFPFSIQNLDRRGNPRSVILWTSIFHYSPSSPHPYIDFIDKFLHSVTTMLIGSPPSRISDDIKRILQLSKQYKVGDWYLCQNHTEIRIYGCELPPFKLPKYLPMRLFSLEYYRQMINSDEIHFMKTKKKAQLRIKDHLGLFICNKKKVGKEAEETLERLRLKKSFIWPYDPHSFICDRRKKHKLFPYIHHRIPEIEQYENQNEWVEGTLIEEDSTQVEVENVLKDLERRLDLDPFV